MSSPTKTSALILLACSCLAAASSAEGHTDLHDVSVLNRQGLRRINGASRNPAQRVPKKDGGSIRHLVEYDGKIKLGPKNEEVDIYEVEEPKKNENKDNDSDSTQSRQPAPEQQPQPKQKQAGSHVEYDGNLILGPAHEEVDIYETKSTSTSTNNSPPKDSEDDIRMETDKLKAELAKLVDLDNELKEEISEIDPDAMMVTAQVELEEEMMTDTPTAAPGAEDEIAKLQAELAKLEGLDSDLKTAIHDEEMKELMDEKAKLEGDLGQLQQLDEELKEDLQEEHDQEIEDEVTKLKSDLANLEALDGQLKQEIAEEDEDDIDDNKSSKEDNLANLQNTEVTMSNNPSQALIAHDERTAIELATSLENAIAACDAAAAIQPPNTQRVDSTPASTEAQLEINYEEACCIPPLYDSYCTPTETREWCDMRLKCLEADRLGTMFLSKVEEEIGSAQRDCDAASGAVGNAMRMHKIEEKCCMPPYDELLPPCIDREERQKRREENKCDGGLERCVEVEMLKDLREDTVGLSFEEDQEDSGAMDISGAPGDDETTPNVADSYHMNIADGDEGYAYANHIGGREKGGKKSFAYKKKEEFHKEDYYALGGGSAIRPAMADDSSAATPRARDVLLASALISMMWMCS